MTTQGQPSNQYRPLIGVTPGFAGPSAERNFCRTANVYYLDQNYASRVEEAGAIPVLLTHVQGDDAIRDLVMRLDGLLLSGGEDVHPNHYGQDDVHESCEISEPRDRFEIELIRAFIETKKPVLAICRGIQILNVVLGGTLVQDIPGQWGSAHHSQKQLSAFATHEVRLHEQSRVANALGAHQISVNSHHHQAVEIAAPGLHAVAWSEEGVIEAVEHAEHPFLVGVQWHPERLSSRYDEQQKLFVEFVQACREAAHG